MKSTDVSIIVAPFGFGPTGKAIAIARELFARGVSVKILGDENTRKIAQAAGVLADTYQYRTEINLADLRSKVVLSYLDISTKIINPAGIPLVFADSLFWLRGWFERSYEYPAQMVLSQRFFKAPLESEVERARQYREVGAILSSGFTGEVPEKRQRVFFYPGGLRSPYLGDDYGRSYCRWCAEVIMTAARNNGWETKQLDFLLPPQLSGEDWAADLKKVGVNILSSVPDTAPYLMSATHVFISPGIETTLEALASGINPLFTPAFNGSHIPQLIADRAAGVGFELSQTFNSGLKEFEGGTDNLSGLSQRVEAYTLGALQDREIFNEAVKTATEYLSSTCQVEERFPLGKDGAAETADALMTFLNRDNTPSPYYRVSVKAKITDGDKVLLVREDDKDWDLPGGGVEHGEALEEALGRELYEEVGVAEFEVVGAPAVVKMIDPSCGRPLIFLVYDVKVSDVNGGTFFARGGLPENVVDYADEYLELIKS